MAAQVALRLVVRQPNGEQLMTRHPRTWGFSRYLLTGTIRQLGSRVTLCLTLTDTETGALVWSGRQNRPFDGLVRGFDSLVSQTDRGVQTEISSLKSNRREGRAVREQSERTHKARERARLAHNLVMKRTLSRGLRNAP